MNRENNLMILGIRTNIMGTTSFDAKFPKMRKAQDFIVYPLQSDTKGIIKVQSGTRIGQIDLNTGKVILTKSYPNGAYFHHLQMGERYTFTIPANEVSELKTAIFLTANKKAGNNGVIFSDNSGAINIL